MTTTIIIIDPAKWGRGVIQHCLLGEACQAEYGGQGPNYWLPSWAGAFSAMYRPMVNANDGATDAYDAVRRGNEIAERHPDLVPVRWKVKT